MADTSDGGFWQGLGREGRFVVGLVVIALIVLGVVLVPEQLVAFDSSEPATTEQINAARRTLVQFLGGFAVLVGLWLTARRIRASERRAEALEDQIRVTEQGQVTERFTRAIEQLGSDTLQVRLGGIYSLEKIAQDSPEKHHWTVMEVLCAFVRERSPIETASSRPAKTESEGKLTEADQVHKQVAPDVQAALRVIGKRDISQDPVEVWENRLGEEEEIRATLDLTKIKVAHVSLERLDFSHANFHGSDFSNSAIIGSNLSSASLREVDLSGALIRRLSGARANFGDANFEGATVLDSDLRNTGFRDASLQKAYLESVNLTDSNFRRSTISGVSFVDVNMTGSAMSGVQMVGATVFGSNLGNVGLQGSNLDLCQMTDVNMSEANLSNTVLYACNMFDVNLEGSTLKGADLRELELIRSTAYSVYGLKASQLCQSRSLKESRFSQNLEAAVREQCPELLEPPSEE